MENILNKDIFNNRDLEKLSPDYKPLDVVLRMQTRRTIAKDTHNHGILKNSNSSRRSVRKSNNYNNINKEIAKLRHEFDDINLKNRITLKSLSTLKLKSSIYDKNLIFDECLITNEIEESIFLNEIPNDQELEVRNDDEFKVKTKIKPVKQTKMHKETRNNKSSKQGNSRLLDLNKDINENNEDIFRVECTNKFLNYRNCTDLYDEPEEQPSENVLEQRDSVDPICEAPKPIQEDVNNLPQLLTMMGLSSKPNKVEAVETAVKEVESFNNEEHKENYDKNADCTSARSEGMDDILSITPIRVQIDDKETYLIKKFVNKWKSYVQNRKKYLSERRQETLNNFFDKIAKKKMDTTQSSESQNKAKLSARDYNTYQHRYRIQKHIIALQKAKLEEQNRVIEELKYNKIVEASRYSVDAMKEQVRKAYYELDRQLKPKIKCLTNELNIHELEEPNLVLHCLKVPQFLQRMEKRAREREEKHSMIRERRRQMEEERIRLKQQQEVARAEMDKEEKMRRIQELRDKRRKEKIETIRKKQWASRLRALIVMADLHYEKSLKAKYGIRPFRILIEMKRDNIEKAKAHYLFQLKNNTFLHWMWYTEDMWIERNFKAENFHRKKLLKKGFEAFKLVGTYVKI
ncbi:unnamed protein product [Chrysodeixis includens]|uniref:Uncharacterized protein n=1 Tax=Chrysodeixis includens TaxID=689277 RepID=A0A9N8KWQ1_CHRIL|nr:unnamed protein product [Chrysodeixis includens]